MNSVVLWSEDEMGICIQECPIQRLLCSHVIQILSISLCHMSSHNLELSPCPFAYFILNDNPLGNIKFSQRPIVPFTCHFHCKDCTLKKYINLEVFLTLDSF